MEIKLQFAANAPKDWSLVAWGENGEVFVNNADGSASNHWAKGDSMKRFGPQGPRPAFNLKWLR